MPTVYVKSREDRMKLQGYIGLQYGDSYGNEICGTPPNYGIKSNGPRTTAAMISLAKEAGIEASATPIKSPAKDSTDRRARLHRALDCVLDSKRGAARDSIGGVTTQEIVKSAGFHRVGGSGDSDDWEKGQVCVTTFKTGDEWFLFPGGWDDGGRHGSGVTALKSKLS